ncbi:MAG: hypothetical protein KY429_11370 [Actinobacteria bacterium]|nr:hypothetical protein [Actinomycetota bacterium]
MEAEAADQYREILERARRLAEEKRARGEVPENTNEALDRLFLSVAPPGARAEGEGLGALVEMLARYDFDPSPRVESTRPGLGWLMRVVKKVLRPITAWQLRHVTDQLNAYHSAQMEILRAVVQKLERSP